MDIKNETYKTILGQFFQIHLSIQTLYYQRNFNTHKFLKNLKLIVFWMDETNLKIGFKIVSYLDFKKRCFPFRNLYRHYSSRSITVTKRANDYSWLIVDANVPMLFLWKEANKWNVCGIVASIIRFQDGILTVASVVRMKALSGHVKEIDRGGEVCVWKKTLWKKREIKKWRQIKDTVRDHFSNVSNGTALNCTKKMNNYSLVCWPFLVNVILRVAVSICFQPYFEPNCIGYC